MFSRGWLANVKNMQGSVVKKIQKKYVKNVKKNYIFTRVDGKCAGKRGMHFCSHIFCPENFTLNFTPFGIDIKLNIFQLRKTMLRLFSGGTKICNKFFWI